jgi:hypothetical protein
MGRNWHNSEDFTIKDSSGKSGVGTGGQLVITDHAGIFGERGRVLTAFFNDGFHEALLAAYQSGRHHGEAAGRKGLQKELAALLGDQR